MGRMMLEPPRSRTKEKGKRGTVMLISNPIPIKWVTHKLENNNTKKSCPVAKVLDPTSEFPTWESSKGTRNSQGI